MIPDEFQKSFDSQFENVQNLYKELINFDFDEEPSQKSDEFEAIYKRAVDAAINLLAFLDQWEKRINEPKAIIDLRRKANMAFIDIDDAYDKKSKELIGLVVKKYAEIKKQLDESNEELGKTKEDIEESKKEIEKTQGIQLTVFSMVIAIISFILTNVKVLSIDNIDLRTVLLVNISYIFAASILFGLIYIFLGIRKENKILNLTVLIALPLIALIALILIACLMQSPATPVEPAVTIL